MPDAQTTVAVPVTTFPTSGEPHAPTTRPRPVRGGLVNELPRASDQAYALLLERILDLRLPPGSVVNEAQLAELVGLGRMPVREAVARLCGDRFITVVPRRGTFVTPVGLGDVIDMFEAREAIECGVAYIVGRRASDADLAHLRGLVEVADGRTAEETERHLHDDLAIHSFLVQMAGNGLLQDAADRLLNHNLRFWRSHWANRSPQPSDMLSHADLLAAIEARDPDAAERAMREHIAESRKLLQHAFQR